MTISELNQYTQDQIPDFLENLHLIEKLKNKNRHILLDKIVRQYGGKVQSKGNDCQSRFLQFFHYQIILIVLNKFFLSNNRNLAYETWIFNFQNKIKFDYLLMTPLLTLKKNLNTSLTYLSFLNWCHC